MIAVTRALSALPSEIRREIADASAADAASAAAADASAADASAADAASAAARTDRLRALCGVCAEAIHGALDAIGGVS